MTLIFKTNGLTPHVAMEQWESAWKNDPKNKYVVAYASNKTPSNINDLLVLEQITDADLEMKAAMGDALHDYLWQKYAADKRCLHVADAASNVTEVNLTMFPVPDMAKTIGYLTSLRRLALTDFATPTLDLRLHQKLKSLVLPGFSGKLLMPTVWPEQVDTLNMAGAKLEQSVDLVAVAKKTAYFDVSNSTNISVMNLDITANRRLSYINLSGLSVGSVWLGSSYNGQVTANLSNCKALIMYVDEFSQIADLDLSGSTGLASTVSNAVHNGLSVGSMGTPDEGKSHVRVKTQANGYAWFDTYKDMHTNTDAMLQYLCDTTYVDVENRKRLDALLLGSSNDSGVTLLGTYTSNSSTDSDSSTDFTPNLDRVADKVGTSNTSNTSNTSTTPNPTDEKKDEKTGTPSTSTPSSDVRDILKNLPAGYTKTKK